MSRSSKENQDAKSGGWLAPVLVVAGLANWFPHSGEGTTFGQFVDGWNGVSVEPDSFGGDVR